MNISLNYTGENFGLVTYFRSQWNQNSTVYNNKVSGKLAAKSSKAETTATTTATTTGETTTYTTTATTTVNEIELSSDSTAQVSRSTSMPYLRHAYGYAKLFDGNVKVDAGLLSVETWEDSYEGDSCQQGGGVQLEITPVAVPGLNVGTSFIARDMNKDSSTVNWDKQHWTAGARYDEPNGLLTAVAGWDGGATATFFDDPNVTWHEEFVWAELTFWKLPGFEALSIGDSVTFYNPVSQKDEGQKLLDILSVQFDVSKIAEDVPVNIALFGYVTSYMYGSDLKDAGSKNFQEFEAEGYIDYNLKNLINTDVTVKASGAYYTINKDGLKDEEKKGWWGKTGVAYAPNKATEIGLYYSHKSTNYGGMGGMLISAPSADGYDFVSLDFVCKY